MDARSFTDRRPFVALVIGAAIVLWLARDVIGPFVVAAVLAYAFAPARRPGPAAAPAGRGSRSSASHSPSSWSSSGSWRSSSPAGSRTR